MREDEPLGRALGGVGVVDGARAGNDPAHRLRSLGIGVGTRQRDGDA